MHGPRSKLRMKFFLQILLGSMTILLFVSLGPAQEITGSLQGTVKDPTGAVVQGATVIATSEQRSFTATTDQAGGYTFSSLPPGRYKLSATGTGFGTVERNDVTVEIGRTLQVNFDLVVKGAAETVNVTSDAEPIIDVTSSKTATNITQQQIDVLPKNLRFSSVLEVAPGTRAETKSGGFQIDGASGSENVYIVDGLDVTRLVDGTLGRTKDIPFDFVREVQVKSAGYEAEFGGATGGVINVVTRSGTNDWHGDARLEFNFDEFNASERPARRFNRIAVARPAATRQFLADYFGNPDGKDDYRLLNPTFSLGGPILKNKLWFYTSYAPQFERTVRNLRLIAPITSTTTEIKQLDVRPIEYRQKVDYFMSRLDYTPFQKLTLNGTFINSPVKTSGPVFTSLDPPAGLLAFETTSTTTFNDVRYPLKGGFTPSNQVSGAVTFTATPNLVISMRAGRTYLNDKGGAYDIPVNTPLLRIRTACSGSFCPPGSTSAGSPTIQNNLLTLFDITTRKNLYVDATYVKRIFGQQHIFKGGYQLNSVANRVRSGFSGGIFDFFYGDVDPVSGQRGTFGYYRIQEFETKGEARSRNQALFFQDSWQVNPRLTLNLGLRADSEFIPSFPIDPAAHPGLDLSKAAVNVAQPIKFGFGDKIAPRFGAALDLFGDGRIKLYGSFSVFYDNIKYMLPRGSFGADLFLREFRALDDPNFLSYSLANRPGRILTGPIDLRVPSLFAQAGIPPIEPNLKPVREHEFTIGTDYALGKNLVLSGRLTRKQLDRTIEDVGISFLSNGVVQEVFFIANPGFGLTVDQFREKGLPPTPKAVREYTGLEIRLDKRFSNNWYANFSYVLSKLYGNYSGLASSDENGRNSPNVNRFFDLPELSFDSFGKPILGRLGTDRPNTFKAFAAYRFAFNFLQRKMETELGGSQFIYQGIPISTQLAETITDLSSGLSNGAIVLPNGRGDLGRTPVFTQTDLIITHRVLLNERVGLRFSVNVLNLFNEANVTNKSGALIRGATASDNDEFNSPAFAVEYAGPSYPAALQNYLNSQGDFMRRLRDQATAAGIDVNSILNPFYNRPTEFQSPRRIRFSVGLQF